MTRQMLPSLRRLGFTLVLALAATAPVRAEDIDIFAGLPLADELPNVLLVWDNSANWGANIPVPNCSFSDGSGGPKPNAPGKEQGTKMAIEKCAIYNAIVAVPTGPSGEARFNVGLMLFNESPNSISGGYPRKQFLPLTAANKTILLNTIRNITIGADKGNNAAFTKTLHEAYLMYMKAAPLVGTGGTKWDQSAVAGGRYVGAPGNGCGRNHIVFIANGSPGEVTDNEARGLLAGVRGNTTPIRYPSSLVTNSDQGNWADEYARFLRSVDVSSKEGVQSITTHAIAVTGASSDGLYPNFIRAIATQGGGQYYAANNVNDLTKFLLNIFNSIQSVNSVFASASLPISVSAQGTYKNQVFVGVFRPDANARPRWVGNLKQYKIGFDRATGALQLVDSLGSPAINSATGFFRPSAVSFWTRDSQFWVNDPKGTPESPSDWPDGEVVEKGAVGQSLRTLFAEDQAARKVYTCLDCPSGTILSASATERFVATNPAITMAKLGVTTVAEREALIEWIRGRDNRGDERGPGGTTTVRPSIHGDVLHSRPAVVEYGSSRGTVVFYGSNDGTLRAVDGNSQGATAGQEYWAFVAEEFLPRLKRLRDNTPEVRFPATPAGASAVPRDYFFDGPLTVHQRVNADGSMLSVTLYVSMRRGGRSIYALDVTDPLAPRLLWRKSSVAIAALGQTWSEPRIARVKGYTGPVLVLGAGYDAAAEDALTGGVTTMGNAVLVLDAATGTVVRQLATERSMPASLALIDVDYDGYVDRAYAADMGGNVYRVDFESATGDIAPATWTIRKFASLGDGVRKFFYVPDVVHTNRFTAVMLGSGNRERPLQTVTDDRFYTLFDYGLQKGATGAAAITSSGLVRYGPSFALNATVAGCYLPMDPRGEKVVTASVTTGGFTYFSTNRPTPPSSNSCSTNLGIAKGYKVPLFCSEPESIEFAGGGLPPSPVIGEVDITIPPLDPNSGESDETRRIPFIIGGYNLELSGLAVTRVPIPVDPTRRRTYWYNQQVR
ncbi:MAG TPA: PilC/PilY family type IV pilus protein [Casimicrobiaceae bacterium]|nr:PilC/PilY family type IV pilus protein [Casimicrobiaceae bacterium]